MLDTKIGDWALFLNVANVSTLSVNPNTPYKTPTELIDAMKAKPGAISVATAGVNSSGHSSLASKKVSLSPVCSLYGIGNSQEAGLSFQIGGLSQYIDNSDQ